MRAVPAKSSPVRLVALPGRGVASALRALHRVPVETDLAPDLLANLVCFNFRVTLAALGADSGIFVRTVATPLFAGYGWGIPFIRPLAAPATWEIIDSQTFNAD